MGICTKETGRKGHEDTGIRFRSTQSVEFSSFLPTPPPPTALTQTHTHAPGSGSGSLSIPPPSGNTQASQPVGQSCPAPPRPPASWTVQPETVHGPGHKWEQVRNESSGSVCYTPTFTPLASRSPPLPSLFSHANILPSILVTLTPHLAVLARWKLREAPLHHVLHPEGIHPQQVKDHGIREAELRLQLRRLSLGRVREVSEIREEPAAPQPAL